MIEKHFMTEKVFYLWEEHRTGRGVINPTT